MKYDVMTYDIMKYDVMAYAIMTYYFMTYDGMPYDIIDVICHLSAPKNPRGPLRALELLISSNQFEQAMTIFGTGGRRSSRSAFEVGWYLTQKSCKQFLGHPAVLVYQKENVLKICQSAML